MTNMKMPHATEKPVSAVRSLLRRIEVHISKKVPSSFRGQSCFFDTVDHAVFQPDDLDGLIGDGLFVRYADDGYAYLRVDAAQQIHYLLRGGAVQGARRLVGEDDLRVVDEGPCDGDTLFLSARHFVGHVSGPLFQSEQIEIFQMT